MANVLQVSNLIFNPCFKVQLCKCNEKALYLAYYCSLHFEPIFVVRLHPFLLNTRQGMNAAAVVFLFILERKLCVHTIFLGTAFL